MALLGAVVIDVACREAHQFTGGEHERCVRAVVRVGLAVDTHAHFPHVFVTHADQAHVDVIVQQFWTGRGVVHYVAVGADVISPCTGVVLMLAAVFFLVGEKLNGVLFPIVKQCLASVVGNAFVGGVEQQVQVVFIPQCLVATGVILRGRIGLRTQPEHIDRRPGCAIPDCVDSAVNFRCYLRFGGNIKVAVRDAGA